MTFSVKLAASAQQDIRSILRQSGDTLGLAPEDEDHEETIRQVIFKTRRGLPYRGLFIIRGKELHVIHVRGPGQDFMSADEVRLPK